MSNINVLAAILFTATVIDVFVVSTTETHEQNSISLIVSAPLHDCIRSRDKQGQEILTAAQAAVDRINNDSSILPNHDLQLVLFDSCKDKKEIIEQFVNITYYQPSQNFRGLTGFFSHEAISLLLPLVRQNGIVVTLQPEIFVYENKGRGILIANSPTTMANVLLTFVKRMNWERFGLITESTDSYFFNVAASLLRITNESVVIAPYIELHHVELAIHEIVSYNTKVIIASISAQKVAQMIPLIDKMGLLWPDYAWIFLNDDFLHQSATNIIRGIFMIESQIKPSNHLETKLTSESNFTFCEDDLSELAGKKTASLRCNGLANIMYDLVLLTAIKVNENCTDNANQVNAQEPLTIQYNDHDTLFSILHVWGQSKVLIGNVYSNFSISIVNETVLRATQIDDLPIISIDPPIGYTVGMVSLIVLLAVFVTLTLLLYICFRKEPEVKASSFTISLFLFVGCYFNLTYMSLLIYFRQPVFNELSISHQNTVCNLLLWLSGPGTSLSLMLATLLVKILRVYHIFNHISLRVGYYCSDLALIAYILLILTPNIVVNLVWIIVDRYHAIIEYKVGKDHIQLSKECDSKYETVWFGVLCAFLLLLAVVLAAVAIMTRKVRLQHFKDTKKVNILAFLLCLGIILTFSYWLLFRLMNTKPYIVTIPLIIGHSILILSVQSLLFVPKVFPPFWRCINGKIDPLISQYSCSVKINI